MKKQNKVMELVPKRDNDS